MTARSDSERPGVPEPDIRLDGAPVTEDAEVELRAGSDAAAARTIEG